MFDPNLDLYRQHHEDLLREAEEARAAHEVIADRRFNPTLAWMGERMVMLGQNLIKISRKGETEGDAQAAAPAGLHLN
ncbi:MAG: hypothetical protein SF162_07010 [bacterium]|nr:hypothetical protein [bacterium]